MILLWGSSRMAFLKSLMASFLFFNESALKCAFNMGATLSLKYLYAKVSLYFFSKVFTVHWPTMESASGELQKSFLSISRTPLGSLSHSFIQREGT